MKSKASRSSKQTDITHRFPPQHRSTSLETQRSSTVLQHDRIEKSLCRRKIRNRCFPSRVEGLVIAGEHCVVLVGCRCIIHRRISACSAPSVKCTMHTSHPTLTATLTSNPNTDTSAPSVRPYIHTPSLLHRQLDCQ